MINLTTAVLAASDVLGFFSLWGLASVLIRFPL